MRESRGRGRVRSNQRIPGMFARPGVQPARNGKYAGPVVEGKHEIAVLR